MKRKVSVSASRGFVLSGNVMSIDRQKGKALHTTAGCEAVQKR